MSSIEVTSRVSISRARCVTGRNASSASDAGRAASGRDGRIPVAAVSGIAFPGGSGWKTNDGGRWLWTSGSRMPR